MSETEMAMLPTYYRLMEDIEGEMHRKRLSLWDMARISGHPKPTIKRWVERESIASMRDLMSLAEASGMVITLMGKDATYKGLTNTICLLSERYGRPSPSLRKQEIDRMNDGFVYPRATRVMSILSQYGLKVDWRRKYDD